MDRHRKINPQIIGLVLRLKKQTNLGKYKLKFILKRKHGIRVSASTLGRILKRHKDNLGKKTSKYFGMHKREQEYKLRLTDIKLEGRPSELIQLEALYRIRKKKSPHLCSNRCKNKVSICNVL